MSYSNTFITVSTDCPVAVGVVPEVKKDKPTIASIEYELIASNPYEYTEKDVIYLRHLQHKCISSEELTARGTQIRDELFQKPQPCFRASMLPKKFGWGIHYNEEGKIALYGKESSEYEQFVENNNGEVKLLVAMRNSKLENNKVIVR